MRNIIYKAFGGSVLAICALTMMAPLWASGQTGGGRLAGTWNVQVTIRNCQTGAPIRTFASLTTFNFGGTVIDSTSGVAQALRTPGQGVWNHEFGNTYRFSFKSFSFDPAGTFTGSTKIIHEANLAANGDEYTSAGTAENYDVNGNLLFIGCSSTTATRFQ